MALFFSAATGGFYDDAIHAYLPTDALPIAQDEHRQLFDAQASGFRIVANDDGAPIAIEVAATNDEMLAAMRTQRDALLASSDWTQMPDTALTDELRTAWREYRQALRDLPGTITDPAVIAWPIAPT